AGRTGARTASDRAPPAAGGVTEACVAEHGCLACEVPAAERCRAVPVAPPMLDLLKQSWSAVQDALRREAGEAASASWLAELRPVLMERSVVYLEAKSRLV